MGEPSLHQENKEPKEENEHGPEVAEAPSVTRVAGDASSSCNTQGIDLATAYKNFLTRKKGPHKLSGAGRRKLLKLRHKGVPEERARQIVRENKELRKINNSTSF